MPTWLKNSLWLLAALICLAKWREISHFFGSLIIRLTGDSGDSLFHFDDPVHRFMVLGVLIVAVVALWAVYWNNRPRNRE